MYKQFFLVSLIITFFAASAPADAAIVPYERQGSATSPLDTVGARAVVVIDAESGLEILSKNADLVWPLASLTKLLSAATLLDGKPNLQKIVVMQRGDEVGGARLRNVRVGTRFRAGDLLAASLIGSANNATQALARALGPGTASFVKRMNAKATALHLKVTRVYDPTGLNPRNVSTAREIAEMLRRAQMYPEVRRLMASETYAVNPISKGLKHTIKNTNKLLGTDLPYTVAGKTGYIEESGYNFTSVTEDGAGHRVIVVLLGSSSNNQNFVDTRRLADWVFQNFEWK